MNLLMALDSSVLGNLLVGVAAIITVMWTITLWIIGRVSKKRTAEMVAATTAGVQAFIAKRVEEHIKDLDPKSFYTLDVNFANGLSLIVPMIPHVPITVLENIHISVINHSADATLLLLRVPDFGHIRPHFHSHTSEEIEVREGVIHHLETGKMYRPGDKWCVAAGEIHSATFQHVVAIVTHRPTLPTAHERPVNLDKMGEIFPVQ